MIDEPVVLYSRVEHVARITLNRPERLNASNGQLSRELTAAFVRAGADPDVRVVLLMGAGRAFCAGADFKVLDEISADPSAPNSGSGGLRYDGVCAFAKPVIAAVHGPCAGVGLALACAADIRIASPNAVFVAPFARLGLCAEAGLAWLLPRLIGSGHAAEMLLSGRRVGAQEALEKGLVSRIFDEPDFADAALSYAASVAEGSPSSFAVIKRQLAEADRQTFEEARERAAELARATLHAPDFAESASARREKRVPVFGEMSVQFAPAISEP